MNDQYSLFEDEPKQFKFEPETLTDAERLRRMARISDRKTSWEAAKAALPNLNKTKLRIMNLLANHPEGLTSSQVAAYLDIDKGSSSKRLGDLEKDGYIKIIGTRLSDRNRQSNIYTRK